MDRKAFIDKFSAQLKEWDSELEKLEAKAQKAGAEAKVQFSKQIEDLRNKKRAAQQKMQQLEQAGEQAWEELKLGCEMALSDMKESLQTAIEKFK